MKSKRQGFRIEIYWEEFGTMAEGGMEDRRHHEILRPPTEGEMLWIERRLRKTLVDIGLINRAPKKKKR